MAQHFRPTEGQLNVASCLPREFDSSSLLADQVLESVHDLFRVDRMSWRPKMDNAVIYLLLNDPRETFADTVAGLTVLRPSAEKGRIRLAFTREPSTDALKNQWQGAPQIARQRSWENPVQDLTGAEVSVAVPVLRLYRDLLIKHANSGELKRGGTSRPELRLLQLLRRMYPLGDFRKQRPRWLTGAKGKSLELDIYSEAENIAIEVQGPYHHLPIKGHDILNQQQTRDALKRARCAERRVNLLIVDAAALNQQVFTVPEEHQWHLVREMLSSARAHGVYEWPERTVARV